MSSVQTPKVARRRVFYIPGYDPVPPRRYRELYRKEGTAQASISGYELALRPGAAGDRYGWHVVAEIEGARVESDFSVLVWSDIVKQSMSTSILRTYLAAARIAWTYIGSGALRALLTLRKGPSIVALYPVVMLLVQLVLAALAGWAAGRLLLALGDRVPALAGGPPLAVALAWALGAAVAVLVLRWFRARDGAFLTYYLMCNFAWSSSLRGENPPELEARLAQFTERLREALDEEVDEILVVGHSSGAHLGVSVLADLLRGGLPEGGAALSFLTLGQVVPMASFLPRAWRLRADLQLMSEQDRIAWVDVTAPGDGCAFALCDPVAVSGVAREGKRWPLVFSAAFSRTLSPARWRALRWRFFRLHFQYLCAFDRPGDYDYFRITAGPLTLGARYGARAASKSRIERAASKFTSVEAA